MIIAENLRAVAATHGFGRKRVEQVIEMTGLQSVAGKRVGGFSLGMGQRLGIAVALLGDPQMLILDEPVNGLDPEGVLWVRTMLRQLAAEGRTVFLSSSCCGARTSPIATQASIEQARAASTAPVLEPWTGFGVMLAWVAVLLTVAAVLLRRRDA